MIDLNADLGEGMGSDAEILEIVTSANIACGGHTGDEETMARAVSGTMAARVAIGAHPSYPDPEGFGRRPMPMAPEALYDTLTSQVDRLRQVAAREGATVGYIKPHGALYHAVVADELHGRALVESALTHQLPLLLAPQAISAPIGSLAREAGVRILGEGFADRGYDGQGRLLPRGSAGAVLTDPERAVAQALDLARGRVRATTGQRVELNVRSVCVHGDTPAAIALVRAIRTGLTEAHVPVRSWSRP